MTTLESHELYPNHASNYVERGLAGDPFAIIMGRRVLNLLECLPDLSTRAAHILVASGGTAFELAAVASCKGTMRDQWKHSHGQSHSSDLLDTLKAYQKAKDIDRNGTADAFYDFAHFEGGVNLSVAKYQETVELETALAHHYNSHGRREPMSDGMLRRLILEANLDLLWVREGNGWRSVVSRQYLRGMQHSSAVSGTLADYVVARTTTIEPKGKAGFEVLADVTAVTQEDLDLVEKFNPFKERLGMKVLQAA